MSSLPPQMSTSVEQLPHGEPETTGELVGEGARQEVTTDYLRSPRDVLRLVTYGVTAVVLLGLTVGVEDAILRARFRHETPFVGNRLEAGYPRAVCHLK